MIATTEIQRLAHRQGVPASVVERDYVLGWLLWGIYRQPDLADRLILKGGNCLRKVYFPQTRYSDDLDFTATGDDALAYFAALLPRICAEVSAAAGLRFALDRTRVQRRPTPDAECQALEARLYFEGQQPEACVTMRLKFDISAYEALALPLQRLPLRHPYSDASACQVTIRTYSLEEVLAEKLRSWIQRTRVRDLVDVVTIVGSGALPLVPANILAAFLSKTIYKRVPLAGRDEMLYAPKFRQVRRHWRAALHCPDGNRPDPDRAIQRFRSFVAGLFRPEHLARLAGRGAGQATAPALYPYSVRSGLREAIIAAGGARQMIRLRYQGRERDIEPYSFRYKQRRGQEREYFYGFDHTRGQCIKSFILPRIEGVSILPTLYAPRWLIEF